LRLERHDANYHDVDGPKFEPNDNLWGGRVALSHLIRTNTMVYASMSRGYKSGGFNTDGTLDVTCGSSIRNLVQCRDSGKATGSTTRW
jgi:hypothetical protein